MPKIVDYPRASLQRALALAEIVDSLGGEATVESAADHMGNKVGGAFKSLVGAGVKYGLISSSKGRVKTEPLFQDLKLAYNESQKQDALRRAFLGPPLFASIAERLSGQPIPSHFEKLLIREYDVSPDVASRLVGYFTDGARDAGIIGPTGTISMSGVGSSATATTTANPTATQEPEEGLEADTSVAFVRGYSVRITGPGIDSRIAIKDEDDVDIVEAMLKKVRRLVKAQKEPEVQG